MPTPRSAGGMSFIRVSPINKSPLVMVSRPAIIRSRVDLPQPDGPTNTTNSPSWMSRLMSFDTTTSPQAFVTLRSCTLAMPFSLRYNLSPTETFKISSLCVFHYFRESSTPRLFYGGGGGRMREQALRPQLRGRGENREAACKIQWVFMCASTHNLNLCYRDHTNRGGA